MRIRHVAALLVGAGLALTGPAALAAPTYPPSSPSIAVSAQALSTGQSVTVTGAGFQPVSPVTLSWTGPGSGGMAAAVMPFGTRGLTADGVGAVRTSLTFTAAGSHVITLTGTSAAGAPVSLSATVTVRAPAAASTDLPQTGLPLLEFAVGALGLLLIGGVVLTLVRRHRRTSVAAPATQPQVLQPVR